MSFPPVLLLLVPLPYLLAALAPDRLFGVGTEGRWTAGFAAAFGTIAVALIAAAAVLVGGAGTGALPLNALGTFAPAARLDALSVVMLLLTSGIATVILRFSRSYLEGEPGKPRYLRWFLATMAAVSLLVITDDLIILALAWTATSLTLHQLLVFYDDRAPALIAAHKKFLLSRGADAAIMAAVLLILHQTGTQRIDALLALGSTTREVPPALQFAGLLLAMGVALRSAQLPFHGWLIQVMEAPTPVSAFLHAGIVNIGGFVLIRLSGLVGRLEVAQTFLVIVGTTTAVLAALVMTTRVSVKVSLAWSTCAQMGFMLLECGLGAYGLALLHLVAHSLYKAHAFLSSGRAVEQQLTRRMTPFPARITGLHWVLGTASAALLVLAFGWALGSASGADAGMGAAALILTFALAPLFMRGAAGNAGAFVRGVAMAAVLVATYAAGHALFSTVAPTVRGAPVMNLVRFALVSVAFVALYVMQSIIVVRPAGRLARSFYPACFAGFYLDELCTRMTFRIWPPRVLPLTPKRTPSIAANLRELHA